MKSGLKGSSKKISACKQMNKKRKGKCQNQLEVARLFSLLCKHTEVRSKAGEMGGRKNPDVTDEFI